MIINIWLMCKYYLTAMVINHHFSKDKGISILLVSHFENVVKMIHMKQHILLQRAKHRVTNGVSTTTLYSGKPPSDAQVSSLMRRGLSSLEYDLSMVNDSVYFYHQINESQNLTEAEIAANPFSIRGVVSSSEDARKVDRFGMVNIHLKSINFSARGMVNETEITTEQSIRNLTADFFNKTIKGFGYFRANYHDIKRRIVEDAKAALDDAKDHLNILIGRARQRGLTETGAMNVPEVRNQKEKFEALRREYEEEAEQFGLIAEGQVYRFTAKDEESIKKYTDFLIGASKIDLEERGYNVESFLFKYRDQISGNSDQSVILSEWDKMNPLFKMYDEFLKRELEYKKGSHALPKYLEDFYQEVEEIGEEEVERMIDSGTPEEGYHALTHKLDKIDGHTFSAKSIAARNQERGIVYGTEKAKYPVSLVRMIIQKDTRDLLNNLMENYAHGMRSAFVNDRENIFLAAFSSYKRGAPYFLLKLAEYKFEFTPDQKKILFRSILEIDDVELFDKLVYEYESIDLYEYQKDRGITFFQSLLMEAPADRRIFDQVSLINAKVNQKIQFIPEELPIPTDAVAVEYKDDLHWHPHYNNLVYKVEGITIKKGWDNLTIAAVMNNQTMFNKLLLDDSTNTNLCRRILPFLTHDGCRIMKLILDAHLTKHRRAH